jgi:hypothetical protein
LEQTTATVEPSAVPAGIEPDNAGVVEAPEPTELNILPSVLGELRTARQKIGSGADPIDIPIPGYEGKLLARFKWVPVTELSATAASLRKIKDPTRQQIALAADALVATNDEFFVVLNTDAPLEPMTYQGVPVSFSNGEGLSVALGFPAPRSARDCVMAVFNNEYAMIDTAQRVMTWLEDTSREVDEAFLGE